MLLSSHAASAQEPAAARTSNLSTAQGIVFEDANQNGQRDTGESGIASVRVSNGREIVLTDAEGRYSLPVDDDDILFVIKPRDWMTPLSPLNLPKFFYIYKPAGSPANFFYPGVDPTGPLPSSVDFALHRRPESDSFKAILFGDPQPRDVAEVEYIAHDVIEQIIGEHAHDAAFGVTLGDIVFDDLTVMEPLNQAIALIGIPWYNVIGNHDLNFDAETDQDSDETFERHYGPSYYSFDHGPAHFLVLDDVTWHGAHDGKKAHYHGGIGAEQLQFIRRDLELIPPDQLVVLMMHIPLTDVQDRHELYRLIEQRPFAVSISAHTHYMEHRLIDKADGWQGPQPHHHIVNVTVCGSWWRGQKDERGIPHATMSDGGPNGYSIMQFDGQRYSLDFHAASRPADYQMNIYAPEVVQISDLAATVVLANVFNGSSATQVSMRVGEQGEWKPMEQVTLPDPAFVAEKSRELSLSDRPWVDLPEPHSTPHVWRGMLPTDLVDGSHLIQIQVQQGDRCYTSRRVIRVQPDTVTNLPAAGG
jgi:3',5'-cyclic AMP phosphodiesterase CpdA